MENARYLKTIKDICRFARENDNEIARFSAVDILQMEYPGISETEINRIIQEIRDSGIRSRIMQTKIIPQILLTPQIFIRPM